MPIDKSFFSFLKELTQNNNLEWFHANKKRYEAQVKEPFLGLLQDVVIKAVKFEPDLAATPVKSMMFRLNRDVRFSKNKDPYKDHISALIGKYGTKDKMYPSAYLHLSLGDCFVCSGAYWFEKETLARVRRFIMKNDKRFAKLLADKKWQASCNGMLGEKNKRLAPEFLAAAEKQPLLYNTQLYWCAEFNSKKALEKDFASFVADTMKAGLPMTEFLREAMQA
jgi:uncharacterized protein (TIGR02453 family)